MSYINPTTFPYRETRWQDLFKYLQGKGFEVYSPATKTGECLSPYLVIKQDGGSRHQTVSTYMDIYTIMCYVPRNQYSKLEGFVMDVKSAMEDIKPLFMPNGLMTPSFYDDSFQAHMMSIEYRNYKKV